MKSAASGGRCGGYSNERRAHVRIAFSCSGDPGGLSRRRWQRGPARTSARHRAGARENARLEKSLRRPGRCNSRGRKTLSPALRRMSRRRRARTRTRRQFAHALRAKCHARRDGLVPAQRQSRGGHAVLVGASAGAALADRRLPQNVALTIPATMKRGDGLRRRCRRESLFEPTLDPRASASSCRCACPGRLAASGKPASRRRAPTYSWGSGPGGARRSGPLRSRSAEAEARRGLCPETVRVNRRGAAGCALLG